jgi:3D (Asp-Asp-Asp) domain-containing protein
MLKEKRFVSWRRMSRLRILVIIAGFACLLHVTRREGSPTVDAQVFNYQSFTDFQPVSRDMESFQATAYCVTGITKSGIHVAPGHVAADPRVIPLGSMIYVDSPLMGGIYQVLDTGALIKGKIIDIYIPSYEQCLEFGRRMVKVRVLRYGFQGEEQPNPQNRPRG